MYKFLKFRWSCF